MISPRTAMRVAWNHGANNRRAVIRTIRNLRIALLRAWPLQTRGLRWVETRAQAVCSVCGAEPLPAVLSELSADPELANLFGGRVWVLKHLRLTGRARLEPLLGLRWARQPGSEPQRVDSEPAPTPTGTPGRSSESRGRYERTTSIYLSTGASPREAVVLPHT